MVENRTHFDTEYPPHAGLHIPAQGAGAVQVIPGTVRCPAQQLQVIDVPHTDGPFHCLYIGQRVVRLLQPFMTVDQKTDISGFIPRHQIADDDPFLGIGRQHRG